MKKNISWILMFYCLSVFSAQFTFVNEPVEKALLKIAMEGQINLIVGKGVSGSITLSLSDPDPLKALELICRVKDLYLSKTGDIFSVSVKPVFSSMELYRCDQISAEFAAAAVNRAFPDVRAEAVTGSMISVYSSEGHEKSRISEFISGLSTPGRNVSVSLRMEKVFSAPGVSRKGSSVMSLMLMEERHGRLSIGREEIVEVWPFLFSQWKGYSISVRCSRISSDDTVNVDVDWICEDNGSDVSGTSSLILKKNQEISAGVIYAEQDSSGWRLMLHPSGGEFSINQQQFKNCIRIYLKADF